MQLEIDQILERARERCGTLTEFAAQLGRSHSAPVQWKRVPADLALKVATITGFAPWEIRSDLYPQPAKRKSRAAA